MRQAGCDAGRQAHAEVLGLLALAASSAPSRDVERVVSAAALAVRRLAFGLPLGMPPGTPLGTPLGLPETAPGPAQRAGALRRLSYVSRAAQQDPAALRLEAEAIAAAASRLNRQAGITGALAVGGGWFAQVLEGPEPAVLATFDRLLGDPRHADIRLIEFVAVRERLFEGWSMAWSGEVPPDLPGRAAAGYERQERDGKDAAREPRRLAAEMRRRLPVACVAGGRAGPAGPPHADA